MFVGADLGLGLSALYLPVIVSLNLGPGQTCLHFGFIGLHLAGPDPGVDPVHSQR